MRICCWIGVEHARCDDNCIRLSFIQNASQNCCSKLTRPFCCHQKATSIVLILTRSFSSFSHMRICCLIGVQHARCEDNFVCISFPLNESQNCCLTLLDHFVDIKREGQTYGSSRQAFYLLSHMRICFLIGVQRARYEDNCVSISFTQNASQKCCLTVLVHFL